MIQSTSASPPEWRAYRHKQDLTTIHEARDAGEDVSGPIVEFRFAGMSESTGFMDKEVYETMYKEIPVG